MTLGGVAALLRESAHRHGTAATHDCCGCPAASAVHGSSELAAARENRGTDSSKIPRFRGGHRDPLRTPETQMSPRGISSGCAVRPRGLFLASPNLGTRIGCRLLGFRANKPTAHGTYTHYIFTQGASGGHWSPPGLR